MLNPLVADKSLEEMAKGRAKELTVLFEHTRPNDDYSGQGHRRNMLSEDFNGCNTYILLKKEGGLQIMRKFELDKNIILELPSKYNVRQEKDEDGELTTNIESGEYINDEGMNCYEFQGNISYCAIDPDDYDEEINSNNLLEVVARSRELENTLKLPVRPEIVLGNKEMSISVLGSTLDIFILALLIKATDNSFVLLVSSRTSEDDSRSNDVFYDSILEIAESVRIFGKKVSLDNVSSQNIERHFESRSGDGVFKYDFVEDYILGHNGQDEYDEEFKCVDPDESLYPHYASIKNNFLGFIPGVVVNASGTEYEFHTFDKMLNTYSTDPEYDKRKPLLRRINELNPKGYTLGETARNMIRLFRVSKNAFVEGHDRESELLNNYMRRAYMMSALRSFAWTLADYCKQNKVTPETVDRSIPERIADFVGMREWLNYDDKSYCMGLCGGSDLHVFFVPDSVSDNDKKQLLPNQDDFDRVNNMKEQFPSYNEILSEVHSLESLRKDLEYIYPAVKVLYENLAVHRDKNRPLEGNAADIVYAWIAIAIAAEGPFFSEDGPVNYYHGWPGEFEEREAQRKTEAIEKWMVNYGEYLENNPTIEFEGRNFVFSGLTGGKDNPIVQKVIERGGVYKSRVSGLTDYLVVEPYHSGESKICSAIEQRDKGKDIKVVLLEKLETVLTGEDTTAPEQDKITKPLSDTAYVSNERSDYEFGKSQPDNCQNDDGWGSGITVDGKTVNNSDNVDSAASYQNDDGWGSGITVDGKTVNNNDNVDSAAKYQNDDGWGSGITVDGKKL